MMSFSGLAANFGGVPLAFAFIATFGHTGFISVFLKQICFTSPSGTRTCPFDIYQAGFNLYSLAGLTLGYLYFQFPLMVLTIAPALEGLKREWREASENLGGILAVLVECRAANPVAVHPRLLDPIIRKRLWCICYR